MIHHVRCPSKDSSQGLREACQCDLLRSEDARVRGVIQKIAGSYAWRQSEKDLVKRILVALDG